MTGSTPKAPAGHAAAPAITITTATMADLDVVTSIEAQCFPAAEAAGRDRFAGRLAVFADHFWIARQAGGTPVGMINGMVVDSRVIDDEMYARPCLHRPGGAWQSVFGLAVVPAWQHHGYAVQLMLRLIDEARRAGRRGCILACKDEKIGFYEQFGYRRLGASASCHGGARWNDMILEF